MNRRQWPSVSFFFSVALSVFSVVLSVLMFATATYAEDKAWTGAGDGSSWSDLDNWQPAAVPTSDDDVTIDAEEASIVCTQTFEAKSVTVGGKQTASLVSNSFVFGTIAPDSVSDPAIVNRKGGKIILKGPGTLTLQGQYKGSKETLVTEPSFIFWLE